MPQVKVIGLFSASNAPIGLKTAATVERRTIGIQKAPFMETAR
jgi:hypothetical protein